MLHAVMQILSAAQAPVAGTTAAPSDATSRDKPKTTFSIDKPSNGRRQQEANREAPASSNVSTRQPLQRQHKKNGAVTSSDLADESHVATMGQAVTPQVSQILRKCDRLLASLPLVQETQRKCKIAESERCHADYSIAGPLHGRSTDRRPRGCPPAAGNSYHGTDQR
jgi:hypothetical protein